MGNKALKSYLMQREVKVLFVGLDGSGKTTLLYRLKFRKSTTNVQLVPTVGYNTETIRYGNVSLACWDVGVRAKTRTLVKHYLPGTEGLIFVVDSTDKERLNEALTTVLEPITEDTSMRSTPVLIMANKQDIQGAISTSQLHTDIVNTGYLQGRTWKVFGVSATTGNGLNKALDWLVSSLPKQEKHVKMVRSLSEPGLITPDYVSQDPRGETCDNARADVRRTSFFSGVLNSIRTSLSKRH